jgi:hypothetical protein
MWGATMAVRRSAWQSVADKVTDNDSLVHEDQDVSLWIAGMGGKIIQDNKVLITTYGQRYVNALKFFEYKRLFENTRTIHENNGNLSSPDLKRLEYWRLFPGLVVSVLLGFCILLFSLFFLPFDLASRSTKTGK